ncbi:unnamed protein product, partial [Prunus brigantina]
GRVYSRVFSKWCWRAAEIVGALESCCPRIRFSWASQDAVEKLAKSGRNYRKISGISLNVGCGRIVYAQGDSPRFSEMRLELCLVSKIGLKGVLSRRID